MIFNKFIRQKLYTYFINNMGMYEYRNGWLKGDCPECGEHKFGVNLQHDRSNCFKCGYKEKPISIIKNNENLSNQVDLMSYIEKLDSTKIYEPPIEAKELREGVQLPEGFTMLDSDGLLPKLARKYLKKRGFNIKELIDAGFGVCTEGKYFGYIIMPFYQNNELIYFNARRLLGTGPKFNTPEIEEFGLGKNMMIYNIDALKYYKRIFLVESVTNARTIGDNSIATGGKAISDWQINIIIKSPIEKVIIGLDKDGIKQAIELAYRLINYKKVKVLEFDSDKDINDLGRNKTIYISNKSKYMNTKDLLKLKHKYNV